VMFLLCKHVRLTCVLNKLMMMMMMCSGRVSCETVQLIWLKFCTMMEVFPDTASRTSVAIDKASCQGSRKCIME